MNPSDQLLDVISATSLALAVLAALYTLWLGDVNAALRIVKKPDKDDRNPQRVQVMRAFWSKAVPLSFASISALAIVIPRTLVIVCEAYRQHHNWQFDDVKAMFVLTVGLLALLAVVALVQFVGLIIKRIELN